MIRLLICESGGGYGGSASYLYGYLQHFNREIFNPIVLLKHDAKGPFVEKIRSLGVQIVLGKPIKDENPTLERNIWLWHLLRILFRFFCVNMWPIVDICRILKKYDINIVLLNQEVIYHFPVVMAAKISGLPCIVRKGGVGTDEGRKMRGFLSKFPDAFICSSNAEYRNHLDSKFAFKKLVTLYEGVDIDNFCPGLGDEQLRSKLGIHPNHLVIILLSRIVEGKGHDDLIDAAARVFVEFPKCIFLVVGDGDQRLKKELMDKAKFRHIDNRVIFTGWRTDTINLLRMADMYVHCPNKWREGMGIATLEAIACGKPAVITDNWGLADTVEDGFNGFVVPIGDTVALANRLLMLLNNEKLRVQMGEHSRERAIALFDIRKNVNKIESLMCDVIREKGIAL